MGGGWVFFVDVREEGQLVAAMPKLPDLFGDLLDPAGDDLAVDLVVLVLREVPVDDFFLRRELRFDRGQFGLVAGPCLVMRGPGGDDRVEGIVEPIEPLPPGKLMPEIDTDEDDERGFHRPSRCHSIPTPAPSSPASGR